MNQCCLRAFAFFLDLLCVILVAIVVFKFLIFDNENNTPGNVGLAITQSSLIILNLQQGVRFWVDFENLMTSVERILEYTNAPQEISHGIVETNWPSSGDIEFDRVYLSYTSTGPILKKLTFTIEPGEKIGLVGRTGSGKSSIFSVLFRLYDFEGKITIDGVDIKSVQLHFRRSKILVIPQECCLFGNVGPLGKSQLKNFGG